MEVSKTKSWNTIHDTANRRMIHQFECGLSVVVDWGNMKLKSFRNGEVITSSDFIENKFSLADYENLLLTVEKSVEELKSFNNGQHNNNN